MQQSLIWHSEHAPKPQKSHTRQHETFLLIKNYANLLNNTPEKHKKISDHISEAHILEMGQKPTTLPHQDTDLWPPTN